MTLKIFFLLFTIFCFGCKANVEITPINNDEEGEKENVIQSSPQEENGLENGLPNTDEEFVEICKNVIMKTMENPLAGLDTYNYLPQAIHIYEFKRINDFKAEGSVTAEIAGIAGYINCYRPFKATINSGTFYDPNYYSHEVSSFEWGEYTWDISGEYAMTEYIFNEKGQTLKENDESHYYIKLLGHLDNSENGVVNIVKDNGYYENTPYIRHRDFDYRYISEIKHEIQKGNVQTRFLGGYTFDNFIFAINPDILVSPNFIAYADSEENDGTVTIEFMPLIPTENRMFKGVIGTVNILKDTKTYYVLANKRNIDGYYYESGTTLSCYGIERDDEGTWYYLGERTWILDNGEGNIEFIKQ